MEFAGEIRLTRDAQAPVMVPDLLFSSEKPEILDEHFVD